MLGKRAQIQGPHIEEITEATQKPLLVYMCHILSTGAKKLGISMTAHFETSLMAPLFMLACCPEMPV